MAKLISIGQLRELLEKGWKITYITQWGDEFTLSLENEEVFFEMKVKVPKADFLKVIHISLTDIVITERIMTISINTRR